MPLKIFQDLKINCPASDQESFIADVTQSLKDGWHRDVKEEERVNERTLSDNQRYSFSCTKKAGRPAANVWILATDCTLEVRNIVPTEFGSLSHDEYNNILNELYSLFLHPVAQNRHFDCHLSSAFVSLEDWVKPDTAAALRLFSTSANKSTGRGHPYDSERWMRFIVLAHNNKESLHPEQLRRWLLEEEGWWEDMAIRLSLDYEYARDVLESYDNFR